MWNFNQDVVLNSGLSTWCFVESGRCPCKARPRMSRARKLGTGSHTHLQPECRLATIATPALRKAASQDSYIAEIFTTTKQSNKINSQYNYGHVTVIINREWIGCFHNVLKPGLVAGPGDLRHNINKPFTSSISHKLLVFERWNLVIT